MVQLIKVLRTIRFQKSIQYICIAAINIDSVMRIDKKNPQVYLQECKYKIKKKKMVKYIDDKLDLGDSDDFGNSNSE